MNKLEREGERERERENKGHLKLLTLTFFKCFSVSDAYPSSFSCIAFQNLSLGNEV